MRTLVSGRSSYMLDTGLRQEDNVTHEEQDLT